MKTKNILITGCSSGIGKNVAITLHNKGWRVFATCRSKTDCTFFTKLGIESFPLDLLKEESINCAVNLVKEKTKSQLDVLFNNGAYAIPGAIQDIPRSAMREIFEVNVFGQIDLINRCIPIMMNSDYPKVINCSSVLGFISLPYRGLYSATKYSIEALTDALRRENYDSKIINQANLSITETYRMLNMLANKTAKQRLLLNGIEKGREEVIVYGIIILTTIMEYFSKLQFLVSDKGVLEGIFEKYIEI